MAHDRGKKGRKNNTKRINHTRLSLITVSIISLKNNIPICSADDGHYSNVY
jgi:hypothetical protein